VAKGAQTLPVIPSGRGDDLHHLEMAEGCDLVLFMAGNQFMAMAELVEAFKEKHPRIRQIFYETLPPGLALKQILAGGAVFRGKHLSCYPDVYTSVSETAMETLVEAGHIGPGEYRIYLHNRLALMVREGNPEQIRRVTDLGRRNIRISQPDPDMEDIAEHIIAMYAQAGGKDLVHRIMEEKRAEATTVFTRVHHRETPLRLELGHVDVGPVWATEVNHARSRGASVGGVEPGSELDQRHRINYYACRLARGVHPENGDRFLAFLSSPVAQAIFLTYGFTPHRPPV
jgi:ABC-type molybdate transport system substrate-binding protein